MNKGDWLWLSTGELGLRAGIKRLLLSIYSASPFPTIFGASHSPFNIYWACLESCDVLEDMRCVCGLIGGSLIKNRVSFSIFVCFLFFVVSYLKLFLNVVQLCALFFYWPIARSPNRICPNDCSVFIQICEFGSLLRLRGASEF